jgi:nickel-dependent lactate racemase
VQLSFPYGDGALALNLPDGLPITYARPRRMEPLMSSRQALRDALDKPVGAPPLEVVARGKDNCLIVTTDHTRQNAYKLWLPGLLDELNKVGLPDKALSVFVASAMRPPMTREEKLEYFGEEVLRRVATHDHDARSSPLEKTGRTDYGTVLEVNELVYKAEMLMLTGGIRYHNFAGYTGGREGILPGSCGLETIESNFSRALDPKNGQLLPTVRPGLLTGNPFSEDMNQACILVKPNYYIDVVTTPDGQLAWLGAGDYGYVPRLGAKFYDEHNCVLLDQPADIALIGSGSGRGASTLYRAHKTLRQIEGGLAPNASVVWVASCLGGEGPPMLAEWRGLSLDEIRSKLLRHASLIGLAALVIKEATAAHRIHLVSDLPDELASAWGFTPHATVEKAMFNALPRNPEKAQWLVSEDASEVLISIKQKEELAE